MRAISKSIYSQFKVFATIHPYDYDARDNLKKAVNPALEVTWFDNIFDDAGRLASIRIYAAGDHVNPVKSTGFSYDDAGNLTGYDDGTTSAVYTYDDTYRKTGETVNYPGFSLDSDYTYSI